MHTRACRPANHRPVGRGLSMFFSFNDIWQEMSFFNMSQYITQRWKCLFLSLHQAHSIFHMDQSAGHMASKCWDTNKRSFLAHGHTRHTTQLKRCFNMRIKSVMNGERPKCFSSSSFPNYFASPVQSVFVYYRNEPRKTNMCICVSYI